MKAKKKKKILSKSLFEPSFTAIKNIAVKAFKISPKIK